MTNTKCRRTSLGALVFCVLLPLAAPVAAADLPRLQAVGEHMYQRLVAKDWAGCLATAAEARSELQANWSLASWRIWHWQVGCALEAAAHQGPVSADTVAKAWQPAVDHFSKAPPSVDAFAGAYVQPLHYKWMSLRQYGHSDAADSQELAQVQAWLAAASAAAPEPAAAAATAALTQLADLYYGARLYTARMAMLHELFSQSLGAGHLASLSMLRARVFNHRQWSRPAAALALSDELAALLARHHPGNERLAMANRSERVNALSGVGRYADALDEGRLLLAWLQARTPTPHGNIMRSAYNLAGLCLEMADYGAAVSYAQLSTDIGNQASDVSIRVEAMFPVVLREQARLLRGDAGAAEDLRRALLALQSYDLAVSDPMFVLAQEARRQGYADLQTWATQAFAKLIADNTVPMQSTRALPLYLDEQSATVGAPGMLEKSSEVLAYGLVGRDLPLAVLAHFSLARHVAPLQPDGAVWLYKRGAAVLQSLRQGLPEDIQGAQKAWLSAYEGDLRAFIGLLIDGGRLAEAEQAIELLRDEELNEFRRRSRGAVSARRSGSGLLSLTPAERARSVSLARTEALLRQVASETDARTDQKATWAERVGSPDSAAQQALADAAQTVRDLALRPAPPQPRPAGQDHAQPVQALPPGVARLSYFVRDSSTDVVLQRGAKRQVFRLPHGKEQTNRAVQDLRAELVRPSAKVPAAAATLHRWLVEPLLPHLVGVRHLRVAPDGALRYVPFAALHDGKRYLVQRYSVSVEPIHLGRLEKRQAKHQPQVAAFGRSLPDEQHSALPGVAQEMTVLQGLRGARVQPWMDAQFSATALRGALQGKPDVVHLATHFVLDAAGEEASYLLMGDGTRMPLSQLRQLPWGGVGLALLSACDSGLALADGTAGRGSELTGLAATLQAAGVHHVMATLWRIDDATTALWMQAFYAPWRQAAGPATVFTAQHLARTQRDWLARNAGTALAHPYHWAAFAWMGQGS